MTAPIDYNAVLADLLAKRGQIDAAIEVIRAMVGTSPVTDDGTGVEGAVPAVAPSASAPPPKPATRPTSTTIENDTFFGLNTADAIRKYLTMMKRPQTARVIAEALSTGGQINSADMKIAYGNVYSALTRNKDFMKTRNKEWGLADWYGGKSKGDGE
jgi:hypothetical protein